MLTAAGTLDRAGAKGACPHITQAADPFGMLGIRGNRGQYLFQRGHESLPLTGIEHRYGITKYSAPGLQHVSRRGSPLVSQDDSD
jgi:hypothetical protein